MTRRDVTKTSDPLEPATMRVDDAARLLGIGRQTAYDLANQGKLPGARRLGRRIVVSRKALELYLLDPEQDLGQGN